jgi:hypothetical protein
LSHSALFFNCRTCIAPYEFASTRIVASSITSVIANPSTGEYVGQVLLDYLPIGVTSSVRGLSDIFSFLITPGADVLGGDTVVGPNKTNGWESSSIVDLLFPFEGENSENRNRFVSKFLPMMKAGSTSKWNDQVHFNVTKEDGLDVEMCLAFAPVAVRIMLGTDPSDFAASVNTTESLIYSIGVARPCSEIKKPFDAVEGDVNEELELIGLVYVLINTCATLLFILFSVAAAASVGKVFLLPNFFAIITLANNVGLACIHCLSNAYDPIARPCGRFEQPRRCRESSATRGRVQRSSGCL